MYAELRRKHPHLPVQRLHKRTLLALSWAIEDEFCAKAEQAILFGAFQQERYYAAARARWHELALVSRSAFAFAEFPELDRAQIVGSGSRPGPVLVPLPPEEPTGSRVGGRLRLGGAPGRAHRVGAARPARRTRPRAGLRVDAHGRPGRRPRRRPGLRRRGRARRRRRGAPALYDLADQPGPRSADLGAVSAMLGRVLSYVDRFGAA